MCLGNLLMSRSVQNYAFIRYDPHPDMVASMKYFDFHSWFPKSIASLGIALMGSTALVVPSCFAQDDIRSRQFNSNPTPAPQPVNWFSPTPGQTPATNRTGAQWDSNPNPAPQPVNWFAQPGPAPQPVNWFAQPGNQNPGQTQTPAPGAPQTGALSGTGRTSVGGIAVGTRILVSPLSFPNEWLPATVLKVENGGYVIRLDKKYGEHYSDVFKVPDTSVKMGNVAAAPPGLGPISDFDAMRHGLDIMAGATMGGAAPAKAGMAGVNNFQANATNTGTRQDTTKTANNAANAYASTPPEYRPRPTNDNVKGVGAPPDGHYELYKLSVGSFIRIGSIEIRGNNYRGLTQDGAFHPYTIDTDGGITWTGGLVGMPQGWQLKKSFYTGLDPGGKPRIEVKYLGVHNTLETADATRN